MLYDKSGIIFNFMVTTAGDNLNFSPSYIYDDKDKITNKIKIKIKKSIILFAV